MAKDCLNYKSKIGSVLIIIGVICTLLSMTGLIYDSLYSYKQHHPDCTILKIENKKNDDCSDSNECRDVTIQVNVKNNESLVSCATNTTIDRQIQTEFKINHSSIQTETEDIKLEELFTLAMKQQPLLSLNAWVQKFNCQLKSS